MNKVDQHIKRVMLTYPSIAPSRIAVLRHLLLCNGNAYDWDDKGCLVPWSGEDYGDTMKFSDLEPDPTLERFRSEPLDSLYAFRDAETEEERLVREHRAKHIDVYAQHDKTFDRLRYEDLTNISLHDYTCLGRAPFGKLDPDWLHAAEEIVDKVRYAFNIIWSLHYDHPLRGEKKPEPSMFSRMPEYWQKLYTGICEIDDKLDAQSGRKARRAEAAGLVLKVLKEAREGAS